jgi:hypothetical protein
VAQGRHHIVSMPRLRPLTTYAFSFEMTAFQVNNTKKYSSVRFGVTYSSPVFLFRTHSGVLAQLPLSTLRALPPPPGRTSAFLRPGAAANSYANPQELLHQLYPAPPRNRAHPPRILRARRSVL